MKHTLTGNDLALAESSVQIALAWWKGQPKCGYRSKELQKLGDLNKKLSALNQFAYPYEHSDHMPLEIGDEKIMTINRPVVGRTCAAARKSARVQ